MKKTPDIVISDNEHSQPKSKETNKNVAAIIRAQLPGTLSVKEAVAAMINLPYISEDFDMEGLLQAFIDDAENKCDTTSDKDEIETHSAIMTMHFHRLCLAKALKEVIENELHALSQGSKSKLRIDEYSTRPYDLATSSLTEWAEELGFGMKEFKLERGWRNMRDRTYSSPYLEIIEYVIREFYEEGGGQYAENKKPPNKKIARFIEKNYPGIPEHMIESICTILKPDINLANEKIETTDTTWKRQIHRIR